MEQGSVLNPTIETVSGKFLNVLDPDPNMIDVNDISWAISRISRFAGHTITTIPYTVGQHSVFVAELISRHNEPLPDNVKLSECILIGLLHDAAEAYIGDIPSPVKHLPMISEAIDTIETKVLDAVFIKYLGRLPYKEEWDIVKFYDKKAQFIEAGTFMVSRGMGWFNRDKYNISLIEMQSFPVPKEPVQVYLEFNDTFEYYMEESLKQR